MTDPSPPVYGNLLALHGYNEGVGLLLHPQGDGLLKCLNVFLTHFTETIQMSFFLFKTA